MARPGQRLRPSLANPDVRLDVPTIEERCAALVINAKGVLHFYMSLYEQGWRPGSFDDMLRNWYPFESYKTNQLLAEAQYMHHFVDIEEVTRSLRASGQPRPDGFEEAMKMANCATFVHYVHQLPTEPVQYGRSNGQSITSQDVVRAPLRNISELSDARRIFLRWIVPFDWELSDEALNMLLDMSIQLYIHRVERIVEEVRAGEMAEDVARSAISDHLVDLMGGEVVRHSLSRVRQQRRMSRADIERMVQRYETFANVRQIELENMKYDYEAMRDTFSFQSMSADLTGYVRDVVREVDAGMHSTTLPLIIDRLARESSVFSASDVPEVIPSSSSVAYNDSSSLVAGPSQSTPKAAPRSIQKSQPFASQYVNWLDDMLEENDTQAASQTIRPAESSQDDNADIDLTETQKMRELDHLLMESSADERDAVSSSSVDLDVASSPPRTGQLSARLSAALNSSGRNNVQRPGPALEAIEASETSDATAIVELRRNRDGPFDSPAKEKAGRLGFDNQNRLVRLADADNRKQLRLLDGSAAAVRESRFDSQGEDEEDVFLENAVAGGRRRKRKGKGKAAAAGRPVEAAAAEAQRTPRLKRALRSNAAQRQPIQESDAATEDMNDEDSEPQTARRTGSRRAARRAQLKEEAISPAKPQAAEPRTEEADTDRTSTRRSTRLNARMSTEPAEVTTAARVTRSRAAHGPSGDGGATGLGRGLPNGEDRAQGRILSTASGRLIEEGERSDDDEESNRARNRLDGVNAELGPTRATPDENFIGDDDGAILDRRAALDAAIAAKKPRPGTLHFHRPDAEEDVMPLLGLDAPPQEEAETIDAIAMRRNGDSVAAILRTSDPVPHRRIGPYRPGDPRNRAHREEADPVVDHYDSEEVDELEDENAPTADRRRRRRGPSRASPSNQTVRVEPYKRSNLYVTGHNMTGRAYWTDNEVTCLLDSLHELARYKKVAPKFKVYHEILKRHGPSGTQSTTLARWNNVQLKDKSRNELMRMKREGVRIPYWKRLLHPNIWKAPPASQTALGRRREETEDVPDVADAEVPESEAGDAEDPIVEVQEEGEANGEGQNGDGIEVVINGTDQPRSSSRSSNPLRNDP